MRVLLACLLVAGILAAEENVRAMLERIPTDHPRLLLTADEAPALRRRIRNDPVLGRTFARVQEYCRGLEDEPPITRELTGRRLLFVSRECLRRVGCLALAHLVTGEEGYLRRAEREMLAAAAFADWNPTHFLDVAEMTTGLALGYDWLHADLAPEARKTIATAIIELGLEPGRKDGWWVKADNNWNPVCHAGLICGSLAVREDAPELSDKLIIRAVRELPRAFAVYGPDGAYPEGPMYWDYGTAFAVLASTALETACGDDAGLSATNGFLKSADYLLHVTGPTGRFFTYSDCRDGAPGVTPPLYWFAARRERPYLLWFELERLRAWNRRTTRPDRLLPLLFATAGELPAERVRPTARHWHGDGINPVAFHRSSWDADAVYLAIKGGTPSSSHAHMDAGSFVLDAYGTRWAEDLGMQDYHSLESRDLDIWDRSQDSDRWRIFRYHNRSHNTLLVDDAAQQIDGKATIASSTGEGATGRTVLDLGPVYADRLAAVRRGAALRADGTVLIQDELRTGDAKVAVRWGMVTCAAVEIAADGRTALLQRDGERLALTVLAPATATLAIVPTDPPPADHDAPNPGTHMLAFTIEVPAGADATLAVLLIPGAEDGERPEVVPLSDW